MGREGRRERHFLPDYRVGGRGADVLKREDFRGF